MKNDSFTLFSKNFIAWLVSHFLLKITSNVEHIKSNHQKKIYMKVNGRNAMREKRKLKRVKSRFFAYVDFV